MFTVSSRAPLTAMIVCAVGCAKCVWPNCALPLIVTTAPGRTLPSRVSTLPRMIDAREAWIVPGATPVCDRIGAGVEEDGGLVDRRRDRGIDVAAPTNVVSAADTVTVTVPSVVPPWPSLAE